MKYKVQSPHHHLLHILRFFLVGDERAVLNCEWQVRVIFNEAMFPEHGVETPFVVSGMRLLERTAITPYFEETEIVRLNPEVKQGYDLLFWLDMRPPSLTAETDNERLYLWLKEYIDATSGPEHRRCFL